MKNRIVQQVYVIKKNCIQEMVVHNQLGVWTRFEILERG